MGFTTTQRQPSLPGEIFMITKENLKRKQWAKKGSVIRATQRYAEELGCLPAVPWPTFMDGVQVPFTICGYQYQ